jgi:hypothetical protein
VRARLAGVRGVLDWYAAHVDSTGLLGPMPYWNYVDWTPGWTFGVPPGAVDGHSATITLLYAYALRRAANLEAHLGLGALAAAYRARADSLVAAVRARAWDPRRGLFRDAPGVSVYSQQTNVLAVLAGAAPPAERAALVARTLADTTLVRASYYFGFYVFEALAEAGLGDRYVEQLAPWRGMLALGLTSTPETPEPTRSDTHAWAAHPTYGLLATVLGVRPASAGFRTVRVAPALGPLRRADGRVPHPAGDIDVRLARVGERGVRAEVTLPSGLTGEFVWGDRRVPLRPGAAAADVLTRRPHAGCDLGGAGAAPARRRPVVMGWSGGGVSPRRAAGPRRSRVGGAQRPTVAGGSSRGAPRPAPRLARRRGPPGARLARRPARR